MVALGVFARDPDVLVLRRVSSYAVRERATLLCDPSPQGALHHCLDIVPY